MVSGEDNHDGARALSRMSQRISTAAHKLNEYFQIPGRFSPAGIFVITIGAIALAEVIAMIVIYFLRDWSYIEQIVIDASIMTVIIYPVLYNLSLKPLLRQIFQRTQSENILQVRLRLMQFAAAHTLDELLQFTLDEIETLTGAATSFFHFIEADQPTIMLKTWSTNTLQDMGRADNKGSQFEIEPAGVWADAIRTRQPAVHNNYPEPPHRKGKLPDFTQVVRELIIPIIRDDRVVAILGVGKKQREFTVDDIKLVSTLADFAWDVVERKQVEISLLQSEEKFRTFADWTYDWEKWLDPQGGIVYNSPSCERITGYKPEEFMADPGLLTRIVHPDDREFFEQHHAILHEESAGPDKVEYRIISRDGSEHWIEHICRPLAGPDHRYLGRRITDRDITLLKENEKKILEQNHKEAVLTQSIQTIQTDIARDLHDTLGQNVSFLRMNLEHLLETETGQQADVRAMLQRMTDVADESYELIRAMLSMLQSGYVADPFALFKRYADQVAGRSSLLIQMNRLGPPAELMPNQIRQLFYIFREALHNIERHADATTVAGEFRWQEHLLAFRIADDGRGFDPHTIHVSGHYGLKFMRERTELLGGTFSLQSAPGCGTTITVEIPYHYDLPVS